MCILYARANVCLVSTTQTKCCLGLNEKREVAQQQQQQQKDVLMTRMKQKHG